MFGPSKKLHSTTYGPKANRFSTGVSDDSFHVNYMLKKDQVQLEKTACQIEIVRDFCLPSHVIHDSNAAVEQLECKKLGKTKSTTDFSLTSDNAQFRVHKDNDSNHSTVVVLKKGHVCTLDDCVIAYFWFPRLGLCRPNAPW